QARRKGMELLRLSAWRDAPHEPRRELLEPVQGVDRLDAHSRQREIYGPLPRRVRLALEPSPDAERDVRFADCGSLTMALRARSKSSRFAGPMPRASSWATKSDNLPVLIASERLSNLGLQMNERGLRGPFASHSPVGETDPLSGPRVNA